MPSRQPTRLPYQVPALGTTSLSPERLQALLLAGCEDQLRGHIRAAGDSAPAIRQQIRQAAESRQVRIGGLRDARVHILAMPMLLDFGRASMVSQAEVRLFTPGSPLGLRLKNLWGAAIGFPVHDIQVLPHSVLLEAVLGVSPAAVQEFAFFAASAIEGARTYPATLRLVDRAARQVGAGVPALYLLMALVTCSGDLVFDEVAYHQVRHEGENLVRAIFAAAPTGPRVSLLPPRPLFGAIESAQMAQLAHVMDWADQNDGDPSLICRQIERDIIQVSCRYQLEDQARVAVARWSYDSTWRELPDLEMIRQGIRKRDVGRFEFLLVEPWH